MYRSFWIFLFVLIFLLNTTAKAEEKKGTAWIKSEAFKVAKKYSESIACEASIEKKKLVALTPWHNTEDETDNREEAKYALIWQGDVGCAGGSGTNQPQITIVRIAAGDSFIVEPYESSPAVTFIIGAQYVKKVISSSSKSLTLLAMTWGENDAHCCASVEVKIRLKQNEKGDWEIIDTSPTAR